MIISFLVLVSMTPIDCSYAGGFKKARNDLSAKAYGYNLDQYCFAEADESKTAFKLGYDQGRLHAPKLDAANVVENPKDEESLSQLLHIAEQRDREAKQRAEIEELRAQVQKQNQTINQLESDTHHLKNETSQIKEDLNQKSEEAKKKQD